MHNRRALTSKTAQAEKHSPNASQGGELTEPALAAVLRSLARLLVFLALVTTSLPSHAQVSIPAPMEDYSRALECLTLAIAYEAGYESLEGKQAVAEVVLNRLRSSSFQSTVCDVVFAGSTRRTGCQFTFTCDGSLNRRLPERTMLAARAVAEDALANRNPARAPGATHYHADYVSPYWAPSMTRITKIGAHIFYHAPSRPAPVAKGALAFKDAATPSTASENLDEGSRPKAVFAPWGLPPTALAAANR